MDTIVFSTFESVSTEQISLQISESESFGRSPSGCLRGVNEIFLSEAFGKQIAGGVAIPPIVSWERLHFIVHNVS